MGVPTVTTISPTSGLTGGHVLTTITGTNFRLPPVPTATGRPTTGKPAPSVRVTFVGTKMSRVAPKVYVLATTTLLVEVPPMDPEFSEVPPALPVTPTWTAVKIENIDQNGVLIGAETVTVTNGYTFKRPDLAALANGDDSNLVRVVRGFIKDLKRQVLANVALTVAVDYDSTTSDTLNIVENAELPAIILVGPVLRENRLFSLNQPRSVDDGTGAGVFFTLRPPRTVDLEFDVVSASDSTMELLALMELCTQYFTRNTTLRVLRSKGHPELGEVEYEMDLIRGTGDFASGDRANESNLRQFQGRVVIRGVDLDEADMNILKSKTLVDYLPPGASATAVVPSPVILGTAVDGTTTIGQGGGDPVGGANDTPGRVDFEQFKEGA